MTKIEIVICSTKELAIEEIEEINSLKNQYWKHSADEHMKWFRENIKSNDNHIMLYGGGEYNLLAYLNIVHVDVAVNQRPHRMMGIGNVCVNMDKQHSGYGAILMSAANMFIKDKRSCGLLLCHEDLLSFYKKMGWSIMNVENALIHNQPFRFNIMKLDCSKILPDKVNQIMIDRVF